MKENEQTRFIRWGIPGWMMFLAFLSYTAIDVIFSPESDKNSFMVFITGLIRDTSSNAFASATAALLVAAAGIPLGFFIYQIYFYIRWTSPFSRDGLLPPFIVGRRNDLDRTMTGIDKKDIAGKDKWRIDWVSDPFYDIDHVLRWRYIENYFTEIVQKWDSELPGLSLYGRYRHLMDLMHTMGAALFGIYLGYLGYLLAKVKFGNLSLTILVIANAVLILILFLLVDEEDRTRRDHTELSSMTRDQYFVVKLFKKIPFIQFSNPSVIYLLFCFSVLYLGSPSPYPVQYTDNHLVFRSAALIMIAFAWLFYIYKRSYPKQTIWTEFFTLVLLGTVAYGTSQGLRNWSLFKPEWWNVGWAMLVFLMTNMVFVKNRQNTRDDLIAMQNYTIKRHLSIRNQSKQDSKPAKRNPTKGK